MTTNTELMYWRSNPDWYEPDESKQFIYKVKDNAPERAKKSYEMWLEFQKGN